MTEQQQNLSNYYQPEIGINKKDWLTSLGEFIIKNSKTIELVLIAILFFIVAYKAYKKKPIKIESLLAEIQ